MRSLASEPPVEWRFPRSQRSENESDYSAHLAQPFPVARLDEIAGRVKGCWSK
jgi:hypothetical protein